MSKRTPYLEIVLTVAVLAFLALIVAGGFDQSANNIALTERPASMDR